MEDSGRDEQVPRKLEDEKSSISKVSPASSRRHLWNEYRQVESSRNITDFSCKHNGEKQKEGGVDFSIRQKGTKMKVIKREPAKRTKARKKEWTKGTSKYLFPKKRLNLK